MNDEYYLVPNWDAIDRHMDEIYQRCVKKLAEQVRKQTINSIRKQKEAPTMQATYNGFTGELVKLERDSYDKPNYSVSIVDAETGVTASFSGIALEDVKFLGGAVMFGG